MFDLCGFHFQRTEWYSIKSDMERDGDREKEREVELNRIRILI